MLETSRIVTASTPQLLESRLNAHLQDGWQLVGPVQVNQGADVDGGWNVLLVATLVRDEPAEISGPAPSIRGSGGGADREFDGDRLVGDDQAREGFWDRYARGDK